LDIRPPAGDSLNVAGEILRGFAHRSFVRSKKDRGGPIEDHVLECGTRIAAFGRSILRKHTGAAKEKQGGEQHPKFSLRLKVISSAVSHFCTRITHFAGLRRRNLLPA
jgi:hypothetical protein